MRITVAVALAASISLTAAAAAQAPSPLSPAEQKAGWTPLFDGTQPRRVARLQAPRRQRHALGGQGRPVVPRPGRQHRYAGRARHRHDQAVVAVRARLGLARLGRRQQRAEILRARGPRRRDRP